MQAEMMPKTYHGIWRRTLLAQAGETDTSSFVLWLQTSEYHADIRLPASRPSFENVSQLEACSAEQLGWLATQQGFTGVTQVHGNTVQWVRDYDYQPSTGARDIAEIQFQSKDSLNDTMIETGLEAVYLEHWEKIPQSDSHLTYSQCMGENRHKQAVPARLFKANDMFAYVRPRITSLPKAESLIVAIEAYQPSRDTLLDWLDFEISFGEIKDALHGYITHSTLPFREGKALLLS